MPLSECFDYRAASLSFWLKLQFSFTSFCSKYDGASGKNNLTSDVCVWVTERERKIKLLMNKKSWMVLLLNPFLQLSFPFRLLAFSCPLSCVFPPFFQVYFAFVTFFSALLFSLSVLWGRRICHLKERKKSFFRSNFFSPLYPICSDFPSLFCFLFSSAVKRSVDFKSRGVKLFPGKDSTNKFSICEFTS